MAIDNILSIMIWLPILSGLGLLFIDKEKHKDLMRYIALGSTLVSLMLGINLYSAFDVATPSMQFVERITWIQSLNIDYYLGIDGISAPLILLTVFVTPFVVISSWESISYKSSQYYAAFLILEGLMIGVFSALDAILFYVFWEAMLVPMFLIIGIWGGKRRIYATVKFFLYTFLGSVLMLVSFIYLYSETGVFSLIDFMEMPLSMISSS